MHIYKEVAILILIYGYGSELWVTTRYKKKKIGSTEMTFLRKIQGRTLMNRIVNEVFRTRLKIKDK